MATRLDQQIQARKDNLKALEKLGINPYPSRATKTVTFAMVTGAFAKYNGKEVTTAGRMLGNRTHGGVTFIDLQDATGKIQLVLREDSLAKTDKKAQTIGYMHLNLLDTGDFIQVTGPVMKTKAGEISILARELHLLTKTLRPLPDTWYGLKDVEERQRRRYVDMIMNPQVRDRLTTRAKIITTMRDFLDARGYVEVETPTLQPVYGGGLARPFTTHHNALESDFYLRISDEMYLKRLIVGGMEKVYEITKVFRNEGIDRDHNPEFTMFEAQIAYEDYNYGMDITEEMIEHVAKTVTGSTKVKYGDRELDFARPWQRLRLVDAIKKYARVDPSQWKTLEQAKKAAKSVETIAKEKLTELDRMHTIGEVINFVFEEAVEGAIMELTFVYDYPIEISPLAKKAQDPRFTERFELFAVGMELGNNYTELNDPIDLKQRFIEEKKREAAGFEEAHQTDEDYLQAIEHGFPPTCGLGIGLDRLIMLLTDAPTIKEVIAFPTLRPTQQKGTKAAAKVKGGQIAMDASFAATYPSASIGYALIEGIMVKKSDPKLEEEKEQVVKQYGKITLEEIDSFKEVQSYRKMYEKMCVDLHSRKPSPEALLRRVAQGKGLYTVNTCVDAYNLVVMKNRVSLGAFDADALQQPCEVMVAKGGETIDLLGVEGITEIKTGEVYYYDQEGPYNLDYNWRDADRTKITEKTTNILINVDGVYDITEDMVKKSLEESINLITRYCGGTVKEAGIITATGKRHKLKV